MKIGYRGDLSGLAGLADTKIMMYRPVSQSDGAQAEPMQPVSLSAAAKDAFVARKGGFQEAPFPQSVALAAELYFINRALHKTPAVNTIDFSPGASSFIRQQGVNWPSSNVGRAQVAVAIWQVTGRSYTWGQLPPLTPASPELDGMALLGIQKTTVEQSVPVSPTSTATPDAGSGQTSYDPGQGLTSGGGANSGTGTEPTPPVSGSEAGSGTGTEAKGLSTATLVGIALGAVALVGLAGYLLTRKKRSA